MHGEAWWALDGACDEDFIAILERLHALGITYRHPTLGEIFILDESGRQAVPTTADAVRRAPGQEITNVQLWLSPDIDVITTISADDGTPQVITFDLDGLGPDDVQVLLSALTWAALTNPLTGRLVVDHRLSDDDDGLWWTRFRQGDPLPGDPDVLITADRATGRRTVTFSPTSWYRIPPPE